MKKLITFCAILILSTSTFAQSPEKMSYQAVVRDGSNNLVISTAVGMKLSILQGSANGTAVYVETQTPTSNANGLVSMEIGNGTVISGNFTTIDWADGPYFLKSETDPSGGTSYTITGTSQLLSVPYALYAKSSGSTGNLVLPNITTNPVTGITSNSATFGGSISNASNDNQILERGILYATTTNPTINSSKILSGAGIGSFDVTTILNLSAYDDHNVLLKANTTYYVRAYAITENNLIVYGNEVSFTTLAVGQTGPGGGIVFFDKGNTTGGWRYLEAAQNDQSTGSTWGCDATSIPGTAIEVGTGEQNTALIVAGCNGPSAAKICDDLSLGGQTDWFLPSVGEMFLMLANLHVNEQGNFDTNGLYWSSSEVGETDAIYFGFVEVDNPGEDPYNSGYADFFEKSSSYHVRAIRAF